MPNDPSRLKRRGIGLKVALLGGGAAAGVVIATALGASAATNGNGTSTAPSSGTSAANTPPGNHGSMPQQGKPGPGGADPVRSDEHSLGSALTAKLKAAALKAVPGGTVIRVESDAGDGTYEAHMSKSDGSLVTVKFDKSGTVTSVEQGMGKGDPRPPR